MSDTVHLGSGKVRELYALGDDRLLLVASDRISTFDVVLPTEIPDKGRVLTGLSAFWFARTAGSMFVVAPVLVLFAVAQRHIIRAFTFTSLK